MLYWECEFWDYQQAANVIEIIDDKEFFCGDLSLEKVIKEAKGGPDDVEACKRKLKKPCPACGDLFVLDQVTNNHVLFFFLIDFNEN